MSSQEPKKKVIVVASKNQKSPYPEPMRKIAIIPPAQSALKLKIKTNY